MKRILVTGLSGVGKSTITAELAQRGYTAVDADCDDYSEWAEPPDNPIVDIPPVGAERDWVWREDRIQARLSTENTDLLFLSGCAENMGKFLPQFDHIVLLTAPTSTIVERLATRTTNAYGQQSKEVARVLDLINAVEPLLRRVACHVMDTTAPTDEIIARLLDLARDREPCARLSQRVDADKQTK